MRRFRVISKKIWKVFEMKWREMIFTFICSFGLIYQTKLLYNDYLSGKTVVRISVIQHKSESLPAITICFRELFSMRKMAKYSGELEELYKNYLSIYETISFQSNPDNLTILKSIHKYFHEKFDYSSIPAYDLLNKYSIQLDR